MADRLFKLKPKWVTVYPGIELSNTKIKYMGIAHTPTETKEFFSQLVHEILCHENYPHFRFNEQKLKKYLAIDDKAINSKSSKIIDTDDEALILDSHLAVDKAKSKKKANIFLGKMEL